MWFYFGFDTHQLSKLIKKVSYRVKGTSVAAEAVDGKRSVTLW